MSTEKMTLRDQFACAVYVSQGEISRYEQLNGRSLTPSLGEAIVAEAAIRYIKADALMRWRKVKKTL